MKVTVTTTEGTMVLQLMPHVAPHFVRQFIHLAEQGFYEGIPFYRIIKGFMVQTGLNGHRQQQQHVQQQHAWPQKCVDEWVGAELVHQKGFCNVANAGANSQTSEWCIFDGTAAWLTGKHTVFAVLIDGYETLETIASVPRTKAEGWFGGQDVSKPLRDVVVNKVQVERPANDVTYQLEIQTQGHGVIRVSLFHEAAPLTVAHFVRLLKEHRSSSGSFFYSSMPIHRIDRGFALQTGRTPAAFADFPMFPREVAPVSLKHVRGSIAAVANTQGQVCIFNRECTWLDGAGSDTVFGVVTHGFHVLDALFNCPTKASTAFTYPDGSAEMSDPISPVRIHSIQVRELVAGEFATIYNL